VKEKLRAVFDARRRETDIDAKTILSELFRLAHVDPGLAYNDDGTMKPINEIPEDVRRALAGIETEETFVSVNGERIYTGRIKKARFWDKNRSLELLAKHLGLLIDRTESSVRVTGDPGQPIVYRAVYGSQVVPVETNGHADVTNGHGVKCSE
jgi:phage terminase small subunit